MGISFCKLEEKTSLKSIDSNFKKAVLIITIFIMLLIIGKTKVYGFGIAPEPSKETHYIAWSFLAYEKADFRSTVVGKFNPQTVVIIESADNGWALIDTYLGQHWIYLSENLRYINNYMGLYDNIYDEIHIGEIGSQVVKITQEEGNWLLAETWLGDKWINLDFIRNYISLDVPVYDQKELGYPTGCEIVSLAMLINYNFEADVESLVAKMPLSNNPEYGFVGNPASKSGFTIFPQALEALLAEYTGNAYNMSGCTMEDLKEQLNSGIPVVVWVNGLGFTAHAVCLYGYDEAGFYYNDPWKGRKSFISYESFYSIWNKPIVSGGTGRMALSYHLTDFNSAHYLELAPMQTLLHESADEKINRPKDFSAVDALCKKYANSISVYYENLDSGQIYSYRGDAVYFAASIIKAPYCLYVYNLAEKHQTDLDTIYTYTSADYRGGTGAIQKMKVGSTFSGLNLLGYSIKNSDNIALGMLIKKYGIDGFKEFASETGVRSDLIRNVTGANMSAEQAAIFQKAIYNYIESDSVYSEQFKLDLMSTTNPMIISDYPIARKYGWATRSFHDTAIVYAESPYVLIIMSAWESGTASNFKAFRDISMAVQAANEQ